MIAKADPQRNLSPGASTLAPTPSKLAKLAPDIATDNNPSDDEFSPSQPGSTSKLARATARAPAGNNQPKETSTSYALRATRQVPPASQYLQSRYQD